MFHRIENRASLVLSDIVAVAATHIPEVATDPLLASVVVKAAADKASDPELVAMVSDLRCRGLTRDYRTPLSVSEHGGSSVYSLSYDLNVLALPVPNGLLVTYSENSDGTSNRYVHDSSLYKSIVRRLVHRADEILKDYLASARLTIAALPQPCPDGVADDVYAGCCERQRDNISDWERHFAEAEATAAEAQDADITKQLVFVQDVAFMVACDLRNSNSHFYEKQYYLSDRAAVAKKTMSYPVRWVALLQALQHKENRPLWWRMHAVVVVDAQLLQNEALPERDKQCEQKLLLFTSPLDPRSDEYNNHRDMSSNDLSHHHAGAVRKLFGVQDIVSAEIERSQEEISRGVDSNTRALEHAYKRAIEAYVTSSLSWAVARTFLHGMMDMRGAIAEIQNRIGLAGAVLTRQIW